MIDKGEQQQQVAGKKSAAKYKDDGNRLFTMKRYNDAIKVYSKALNVCRQDEAIYVSCLMNKALCSLKLGQNEAAATDAKAALELNPCSMKANFYHGCSLMELKQYEEAIKYLTRAHALSREQTVSVGDDITRVMRSCKKHLWLASDVAQNAKDAEFHEYLRTMMLAGQSGASSSDISSEARVKQLDELFSRLSILSQREIPDYFCGKISFELMSDPVITPSGITYDRRDIEEHLARVGHFDPITRQPLEHRHLIPNFALKEVIDDFVEKNPWVLDF